MGFKVGAQAKVAAIYEKNGIQKARLKTSYKDNNTKQYVTDFDEFVTVFGASKGKVFKGDIILIQGCDVTTKEVNGKKYTTLILFKHDIVKSANLIATTDGVPFGGQSADEVIPKFGDSKSSMPTDIDGEGLPF